MCCADGDIWIEEETSGDDKQRTIYAPDWIWVLRSATELLAELETREIVEVIW